ncbi:hypothetical protein [Actinokineospora cianjurensis]|uniref:hypothetical protein n=1 Tax=Actinokineospora cianjurensis TaxID=585224 RepID=UPI001FEA4E0F|nr:hypothetical protein [Actinokineospora cianjurensis]
MSLLRRLAARLGEAERLVQVGERVLVPTEFGMDVTDEPVDAGDGIARVRRRLGGPPHGEPVLAVPPLRSANNWPSGNRSARVCAQCSASQVFPIPPVPPNAETTTNPAAPRSRAVSSSTNSPARPTKPGGEAGSCRGTDLSGRAGWWTCTVPTEPACTTRPDTTAPDAVLCGSAPTSSGCASSLIM